ncbi:MAG: KpsF/GutQ family sugar-phosphate isomerase [Bdellovibrionales bacterium]|nr:KpsF/GutQ family sugar-phosphate isomerase [Bdellovibrionales bacterium]
MSFKEFCRVLKVESNALQESLARLEANEAKSRTVENALNLILDRTRNGGKVLVCGVGKSGKIAAKFAATLSSTGTPAIYLHPTEAMHGDLGVLSKQDVVIAISYTGNTDELVGLLPFFETRNTPMIGIGGNPQSRLGEKCKFWIDASVTEEACPHHLAPTTSTTVALAITDAIAIALMQMRGFTAEDFARNHPGGSLGRRLQLKVSDLMHPLSKAPSVTATATMDEVLKLSTERKLGAVLVVDQATLVGIITDGDIRRALSHKERFFQLLARDIMTAKPISVSPMLLAFDALRKMEERESQISVLPVVNDRGYALGLIRIHDLVQTL